MNIRSCGKPFNQYNPVIILGFDWPLSFATAVIIEVAYGHQIKKDDDPYLTIADEVCHIVTPAVSPSEDSLVNLFPFRESHYLYIPQWF
jgi:hypothetical protein